MQIRWGIAMPGMFDQTITTKPNKGAAARLRITFDRPVDLSGFFAGSTKNADYICLDWNYVDMNIDSSIEIQTKHDLTIVGREGDSREDLFKGAL